MRLGAAQTESFATVDSSTSVPFVLICSFTCYTRSHFCSRIPDPTGILQESVELHVSTTYMG